MIAIDPDLFAQALADIRTLTPTTLRHSGYVRPERRPEVWAGMAADLAAEGRSLAGIATALCVDEDTAARLLDHAQQHTEATEWRAAA